MKLLHSTRLLMLAFFILFISSIAIKAQSTAFTYQGRLTDSSIAQPTNGTYTMTFRLYDAASGGNQIPDASTSVTSAVSVINNVFSARLDFGAAAFNTLNARYLEIQVGSTTLTSRQEITSTPFAQRAINAGTADTLSAACGGCVVNSNLATNSITAAKILNGNVLTQKLADDAVSSVKILDGTIIDADINASAAIAGTKIVGSTITGLNATNLATGTVPVARLGTNTPTATTFLRGDNIWQAIPSSGTPVFAARTTSVTLNSGTHVNIISVNLEANKTYSIESAVLGQRSGATSGLGNCQAVYTGAASTEYGLGVNGTWINDTVIDSTASYNSDTGTFLAGVGNRYPLVGYLKTTTAGTFTISCARASTNTTVDLIVREGTYIIARPLN